MNRKIVLVILLSVICYSQGNRRNNLYMPINIQKAYEKGTRSLDGKPGPDYWMNKADYIIDAEIFPETKILRGKERIKYYNNSPDDLDKIVIRNYLDFFAKGNPRNVEISTYAVTDGVDITEFKINGKVKDLESAMFSRTGTNMIILLDDKLLPGKSIEFEMEWSIRIPYVSKIRTGAYGESSFFISLWYPRIAVYDDIEGWDESNYTGLQEFYNDYSNYEVNIKVPKEYVVWATGNQTNPKETFSEEYFERIENVSENDYVVHLIAKSDRGTKEITKNEFNTWRYTAENLTDFAFGVSEVYLWDVERITLDSGKEITINAVYEERSKDFYEVADIAAQSIRMMERHLPGIPFPYSNVTIFNSDGDSGMEFPMIINDGSFESRSRTAGITCHELLHQYLPFYVGTNEKKYAWLDEGWARMMQFDIQETIEPSLNKKAAIVEKYSSIGGSDFDIPLIVPSNLFDSYLPYKTHAYTRPSMALLALIEYKGLEKFKEGINEFVKRWNGKHPLPWDFFYTFDDVYKEDLSWFWNPWYFDFGYPDLAVRGVYSDNDQQVIEIENVGGFPLPVHLTVQYKDGIEETIIKDTGIWKENKNTVRVRINNNLAIKNITLGSELIPDVNKANNTYFVELKSSTTFIVAADTHFDPPPESDQYYHVVAMNAICGSIQGKEALSWPSMINGVETKFGSAGEKINVPDGVILAGDITDRAEPSAFKIFKKRYEMNDGDKTINFPVYVGLGNHDLDPQHVEDSATVYRQYMLNYISERHEGENAPVPTLNFDHASKNYSWNFGKVHFIQTHRFAGNTENGHTNSLEWLKNDLKKYASDNTPVVIIQHYPFDRGANGWWNEMEKENLYKVIKNYNIICIFAGHNHFARNLTWKGIDIIQVNNGWSEQDGNGSFAVCRITDEFIDMLTCRWKNGEGDVEFVEPFYHRDF